MKSTILQRAAAASASVLVAGSMLHAQTLDLTPVNTFGYDDGTGEVAWKVNNPSLASDWFDVDFGSDASGSLMVGLWADLASTGPSGATQAIGFTTSAGSGLPDVNAATLQAVVVSPNDGFNSDSGYATPCLDPGSDFHVVFHNAPGDSTSWIVTDTDGPLSGRSFFSSDNFTTAFTGPLNFRMGYAGYRTPVEGTLLVNGATTASVPVLNDVCLTFTGCQPGISSSLYVCSPLFFGPLVPSALTITGGRFGGPCDDQWTLCALIDCLTPHPSAASFCCIYLDPCDLRPFNGKPRAKLSTIATVSLSDNPICDLFCWGQRDDGIVDWNVWKVQNPAGSGDWFNVNHGDAMPISSGIRSLTGVQLSSWDACGTGPCWAEVGVYADLAGIPDIAGTIARSTATNPCMAPGASDSGPYPMTVYDIPDIPAGAASAWHVAVHWPLGDTCIWLGSDTDGVDSLCGITIPSAGTTSGFAADSYASGIAGFTGANWCMKIDWN